MSRQTQPQTTDKEPSRELLTRLRRLLLAGEKGWVWWEKGMVLAYTPATADSDSERLCLSQPNGQPTKADGQRLLRLLGLVLLAEGRSYTDLVVQRVVVEKRPCLVITWRGLVQPPLFAEWEAKMSQKGGSCSSQKGV